MKTGRPEKIIDIDKLRELMRFYPSMEEICGIFDCSPDTISRVLNEEFSLTFREFRNRYIGVTKIALKKKAIEEALSGNDKMLIYCMRTLTDLDDRVSNEEPLEKMDDEALRREIELLYLESK